MSEARDPKGTPLDELLREQQSACKNVDSAKINKARLEWSSCIESYIFNSREDLDEFEELKQYYTYFCRDIKGFKSCWDNVLNLLNTCGQNRGDVARTLYFALYELTCKNNGSDILANLITSLGNGDLCELDYSTAKCNETKKNWYSTDLCRRYEAQKICEQSAILSCNNQVHKKALLNNLDQIGFSLKCVPEMDEIGKSLATSNWKNYYDYYFINFQFILFNIFIVW